MDRNFRTESDSSVKRLQWHLKFSKSYFLFKPTIITKPIKAKYRQHSHKSSAYIIRNHQFQFDNNNQGHFSCDMS